jgi:acylphosphatase
MTQIRAIVHGRVQGVCFRAETVSTGRRLGLHGYARNLTDGTVEVIAAGNQAAVKSLVDFLHEGPALAEVTRVDIDWDDQTPVEDRFDIRF